MKCAIRGKNIILLFLCLLILYQPVYRVYASNTTRQLDYSMIDNYIMTEMNEGMIQGLAIGIVKGNEVVYLKGYGTAGDKKAVNIKTPFGIGSVAKTFTALAIRQLINEGKLDEQSQVNDFIQDFRPTYQGRPVNLTIYQLLTHRSGFSTRQGGAPYLYNSNYSIKEIVEKSRNIELSGPVGSSYEYSNLNYIILGRIIEIASGLSYESYINMNIFDKLEMHHSYTNEDKAVENGLSQGYTILYGLPITTHYTFPKGSAPTGFIFCSIEDMTHYMICYLNKGYYNGNSVISDNSFIMPKNPMENSFLSDWYDELWLENNGYPKGYLNLNSYGYNGATPNFTSSFLVNQESRYAVVVMDNTFDQVNFFNRDIDSSTICKGIMEYIELGNLPENDIVAGNYDRLVWVILILLILLIYSFISIRSVFRAKTKKLLRRHHSIYYFIEVILPLLAFITIPLYHDINWSWLLASNPEINHIIIGAVFWLILLSCIKICISLVKNYDKKPYKGRKSKIS